MYPINSASPQRVAIGAVIQISDGAVQTSGVSVKVLPFGTTASAGGGTVGYEEGIVHYTPTQAETNYTSFILIAYKTGCMPAGVTVVTTASATAGTVLLVPTTHTSAVIPTVSTLTGHTPQTGDSFARLGAPAGASVSADMAAVKAETATIVADTNELQTDWVNGGRLDLILDARASQASVDTIDGTVDAILVDTAEIGAAGAGLTALASASNLAVVAGYLDTEITSIINTLGAAGAGLTAVPWNAAWDAEVQSEVADGLTAFWTSPATLVDLVWDEAIAGHAGAGSTGVALAGATAPTAAAVADAVWDEAIAGHAVSGSTGEALSAAGAAGDPWITALPGSYSAGQAGKIVGDALDAAISSRMASYTQPTGFLAATFPSDPADQSLVIAATDALATLIGTPAGASVSADIAAVKVDTAATLVDTAEIGAAGAGLTALATQASVAAVPTAVENADALLGRNVSGGSSTGRTVKQAFHILRNKSAVAAGTLTVYDTDDSTSSWTAAVSSDAAAEPITGIDPA